MSMECNVMEYEIVIRISMFFVYENLYYSISNSFLCVVMLWILAMDTRITTKLKCTSLFKGCF